MNTCLLEFPRGLVVEGSNVVTAVAQVQSLAWKLPHATGLKQTNKQKTTKQQQQKNWLVYVHLDLSV